MALSEPDFLSIKNFVAQQVKQLVGTRRDYFVTGKVIKVDADNRCVFLAEFGDQPVPIVGFNYIVKYYDEGASGTVKQKDAVASVVMPKVGQTVLVAREMGTSRLPRALGVIQGTNWARPEEA